MPNRSPAAPPLRTQRAFAARPARSVSRTHALGRAVALPILVVSLAALAGCRDATSLVDVPTDDALLSRVAAGQETACVLTRDASDAVSGSLALVGEAIPARLPKLSTARKDRVSGRRFLRVATTRLLGRDGVPVFMACLVPTGVSDRTLTQLANPSVESLVRRFEAREGIHFRPRVRRDEIALAKLPAAVVAGRLLLDLASGAGPGGGFESSERAQIAPEGEVAGSWNGYWLPAVTVTATAGSIITHASAIYWTLHEFKRWSDQGLEVVEVYPEGFCASQSERWIALNEEVDRLREDSVAFAEAATGMTAPFGEMCQRQNNSMRICIDWFIASATTFVIGLGDNRTFNPNAPYGASRAQLYLDLDADIGLYELKVSRSVVLLPAPQGLPLTTGPFTPVGAGPYPHQPKDIQIIPLPDGRKKVSVELFNGFCQTWAPCPTIQTDIIFSKQADGRWVTSGESIDHKRYPSLGIYDEAPDGSWNKIFEFEDDGSWWLLFGRQKMLKELERERDETLGGCELQ